MVDRISHTNVGAATPQKMPQEGMTRTGLSSMEGTKLQGDGIETFNQQIDTVLRQLSKQETSLQEPFKPGRPKREVSQLPADPQVRKAVVPAITKREFTDQMALIGHHRAQHKGKRPI